MLRTSAWESELQRVHRALRVHSAANKALTVASDVAAWLNQVCRSAAEVGGYRMAWLGFAETDEEKMVRPVAHGGFNAGYLESAHISWKDEPRGRGPVGIAVRTGKFSVTRDIPTDPGFDVWRKEALRHGYKSAIALPLIGEGRTFGVLALYAEEVDAFGSEEIEVLTELANDLAFGLVVVFRMSVRRESAAEALAESQRKLRRVERISQLAHWEHDLGTNVLSWSDEVYRILGLEPQTRQFRAREFEEMIHPEDRAKVHKVVTEAVEGHSQYHLDFRLIRPDGQLRYLHGEGEVVRNDAGRAVRTVGFLQDVTELHLGKIAMENANRSLEAKNIALGEILANIETERDKIGQRVNKNVEEIVLPLLHTLGHGATHQQERVIEQIENCLEEITSPFLDKVARAVKNLTPTELRVCNYIRRGLTVKQIADLEHLSPETISAHRRNIRRKLHIANRKINLATYLRHVYHDPPAESN